MAMSCQVLLPRLSTVALAVRVPRIRQVSSLFLRKVKVWSGLLRSKGLVGKSEGRLSLPCGSRSTKFGVKGNTRNGLVPELSLFDSPRFERLWIPLTFTCSCRPPPSSWSRLERSDCFL